MTAAPNGRPWRLFVAVWPDEATRHLLHGLEAELGGVRGLRFVGPSRWHVTLHFLGAPGVGGAVAAGGLDDVVARVTRGLQAGCAAFPGPVECHLGPGTAWFTAVRVLQLPAVGLDALAAAVRAATSPIMPKPRDEQPFNGHLTVARAKGRRLGAAVLGQMSGIPFEAAFPVEHVDLVASAPSPEGHVYTTLARVPLGSEGLGALSDPARGTR